MITTLYLMPTQQCNCRCSYCYIAEQERKKTGDERFFASVLDDFIRNLKKDAPDVHRPQLRFLGGEPYLKARLIQRLTKVFLDAFPSGTVGVNTNGTLLQRTDISTFVQYRNNVIHILSLDGPEKIHNSRRFLRNGENAYQSVVCGIFKLQKLGLPVLLNMVLDSHSIQGLDALMGFVKKILRMNQLSVSLLSSSDSIMTMEEKMELLRHAYALAQKHGLRLGGHHRIYLGRKIPTLRCRAGQKTILVTSDGRLEACQRFLGSSGAHAHYQPGMSLDQWRALAGASNRCYTPESECLGDRLYDLYRRKYPEYLRVHRLDQMLMGVIE